LRGGHQPEVAVHGENILFRRAVAVRLTSLQPARDGIQTRKGEVDTSGLRRWRHVLTRQHLQGVWRMGH
jgi:hypothetical protein